MSKAPSREVFVLETHRANLASAATFEEFKAAQLKFIDYLIKSQKYRDKSYEALEEFASHTTQWVVRTHTKTVEEK